MLFFTSGDIVCQHCMALMLVLLFAVMTMAAECLVLIQLIFIMRYLVLVVVVCHGYMGLRIHVGKDDFVLPRPFFVAQHR